LTQLDDLIFKFSDLTEMGSHEYADVLFYDDVLENQVEEGVGLDIRTKTGY